MALAAGFALGTVFWLSAAMVAVGLAVKAYESEVPEERD